MKGFSEDHWDSLKQKNRLLAVFLFVDMCRVYPCLRVPKARDGAKRGANLGPLK